MTIIGGLDIHRAQITFDYVDTDTGEVCTGQVRPATRQAMRAWLAQRFACHAEVKLAVEACTGWRFVVEEMLRAGIEPHLAEPADTASLRGPKKRAKTDKRDARHLRELLSQDRLPESWIAPAQVQEVRVLVRLYASLMAEKRTWQMRVQAQLYHQGVPQIPDLLTRDGRTALAACELSAAGRQMVSTAMSMIDCLDQQVLPLRTQLQSLARRQPGARALTAHYGIGALCALVIWAELGDCSRFSRSDQAVRTAGLDVTVYSSDGKRSPGHLAKQGPPLLRWAIFEAAKTWAHKTAPEHDYYEAVRDRLGGKRTALSVARKLLKRCYHSLRELGEEAMAPAAAPARQVA